MCLMHVFVCSNIVHVAAYVSSYAFVHIGMAHVAQVGICTMFLCEVEGWQVHI